MRLLLVTTADRAGEAVPLLLLASSDHLLERIYLGGTVRISEDHVLSTGEERALSLLIC